jgi:branched-chain amino acid aminotransferase
MIAVFPYAAHDMPPAKLKISKIKRNEYSPLANIKSLSYLDNVLARREAVKEKMDEAILLNTAGNVAEASAANIFIVNKDNVLVTPRLEDGVLPGITRQVVLKLAAAQSIVVEERAIKPEELLSAREVFLTNSIIEIQSVKQIEDKIFACDEKTIPITMRLQKAYKALTTEPVKEAKFEKPLFFEPAKPDVIKPTESSNIYNIKL